MIAAVVPVPGPESADLAVFGRRLQIQGLRGQRQPQRHAAILDPVEALHEQPAPVGDNAMCCHGDPQPLCSCQVRGLVHHSSSVIRGPETQPDGVRGRNYREQGRIASPGLDGVNGTRGGANSIGQGLLRNAGGFAGTPNAHPDALDVVHRFGPFLEYIASLVIAGSYLVWVPLNLQDTAELRSPAIFRSFLRIDQKYISSFRP